MEKNKENNHLKIVHNANDDKKSDGKKPLSHEELLAEIGTKGTVMEREQVVVENLKRKGFL
jgi:hypothetical protein